MPKNASTKAVFALFCVLHFVCCEVSAQMLSSCLEELDLSPTDLPSLINDSMKSTCLETCLMQKIGLVCAVLFYLIKSSLENLWSDFVDRSVRLEDTIHLPLLLPVFVPLASAQFTDVQLAIINVVVQLENNDETTKMCLRDTNMTSDAFLNVMYMLDRPYSTLINNKDIDKIRGAACLFTCFEKIEGRVSDSKIQLDKIEDLIKRSNMSLEMEIHYKRMAEKCITRVKGMTDECFMALEFYRCLLA